ncbi:MAG: MBL fold metallo-hydrolase [Candidatus Hydrogenedentota bacterium]
MKLTCFGAAEEVTGSKHVVEFGKTRILFDCGMFQGPRAETAKRNRRLDFNPESLDAMVLSHAHIDHSGLLPLLGRAGFRGRIYSTPATRDLCSLMLLDSAHIQNRDTRFLKKKGRSYEEPLYDQHDVHRIMRQFISVPYEQPIEIANGAKLTFHDAGHILGSAMCEVQIEENGNEKTSLFSGDIGRHGLPILQDPWTPGHADVVLMESTYGNRDHDEFSTAEAKLKDIVNETSARGGKIIIPSFALERAQEIVYTLKLLEAAGEIPTLPVYVDSPLAVNITEIFRLHADCFDTETSDVLESLGDPFRLKNIRYVSETEDSIRLNALTEPCIIIAASGMCEFGRILHHLRNHATDPKNTILIVGFQAQHTLGRRIVERQPTIRIYGEYYPLRAEVKVINAFSCHAGRSDLLAFGERFVLNQARTFLVHGESDAMSSLKDGLTKRGLKYVGIPRCGEPIEL